MPSFQEVLALLSLYLLLSIAILIFALCNLIYSLSNLTSIRLDQSLIWVLKCDLSLQIVIFTQLSCETDAIPLRDLQIKL